MSPEEHQEWSSRVTSALESIHAGEGELATERAGRAHDYALNRFGDTDQKTVCAELVKAAADFIAEGPTSALHGFRTALQSADLLLHEEEQEPLALVSLLGIAWCHSEKGEEDDYLEISEAFSERLLNLEHISESLVASFIPGCTGLLLSHGRVEQAIDLLERAGATADSPIDAASADLKALRAILLYVKGDGDNSLALLEQVKEFLADADGANAYQLVGLYCLESLYRENEKFAEADSLLLKAEELTGELYSVASIERITNQLAYAARVENKTSLMRQGVLETVMETDLTDFPIEKAYAAELLLPLYEQSSDAGMVTTAKKNYTEALNQLTMLHGGVNEATLNEIYAEGKSTYTNSTHPALRIFLEGLTQVHEFTLIEHWIHEVMRNEAP